MGSKQKDEGRKRVLAECLNNGQDCRYWEPYTETYGRCKFPESSWCPFLKWYYETGVCGVDEE